MRLFPNDLPAPGRSITLQCFRQFLACVRLRLSWRTWTIFCCWCCRQTVFVFVFMQRHTIQHTFTKRTDLFVFKGLMEHTNNVHLHKGWDYGEDIMFVFICQILFWCKLDKAFFEFHLEAAIMYYKLWNQCITLEKMVLTNNEMPIGMFIKYTDLKQN